MPELLKDYAKEQRILELQYEIDSKSLWLEYSYPYDFLDNNLMTEAEDKSKAPSGKLTSFINNLVTRVSRFIGDFIKLLTSFTPKKQDELTVKDYRNSQTGQKEIEAELKRIQKEVDAITVDTNNVIGKLLSSTGCPDEVVEATITKIGKVSKFVKDNHRKIKVGLISAGTLTAFRLFMKEKDSFAKLLREKIFEKDNSIRRESRTSVMKLANDILNLITDVTSVMNFTKETS